LGFLKAFYIRQPISFDFTTPSKSAEEPTQNGTFKEVGSFPVKLASTVEGIKVYGWLLRNDRCRKIQEVVSVYDVKAAMEAAGRKGRCAKRGRRAIRGRSI